LPSLLAPPHLAGPGWLRRHRLRSGRGRLGRFGLCASAFSLVACTMARTCLACCRIGWPRSACVVVA